MTGCTASLVVLNWHHEAATVRCVESLRRLQGIEDCEVIVVDNESSEASRRALEALDQVRVVPLDLNLGFAGGMNAGIFAARGHHIALFNNDLVVDPAWLREGLRVLKSPTVGIVGGAALDWDGEADPDPHGRAVAMTGVDPQRGFALLGPAPSTERPIAGVDGSNILAKAEVLRALGGFDADYFAYGEDVDLCARAWALGHATVFSPAMRVWHRRGGSSDKVPRRRAFWAARNHIVTVVKHFPRDRWCRTALGVVADDLVAAVLGHRGLRPKGARRLDCDQRLALARAAWWAITHAPELARKRKATIALGQHDEGYTRRLRTLENYPGSLA